MTIFKLAVKNLLGAGMRTWLNVIVLSFCFVLIIFFQGMLEGTNRQVAKDMVDTIYGGGQVWHEGYDPFDPLSLQDAHGAIPAGVQSLIDNGQAVPILVVGRKRPDHRTAGDAHRQQRQHGGQWIVDVQEIELLPLQDALQVEVQPGPHGDRRDPTVVRERHAAAEANDLRLVGRRAGEVALPDRQEGQSGLHA